MKAMAAEIHRLRDIIGEVEKVSIKFENSQILADQQMRHEVQIINKKLIDVETRSPKITGRFDELLAQLEIAKRKITTESKSLAPTP